MKNISVKLATEALGAFGLVFIGGFAVLQSEEGNLDLVGVAIAHALVLGIMVYFGGRFSGAHYNPAVTISFLVTKEMTIKEGALYIISQLVGSIIAGLCILLLRTDELSDNPSKLGFPHLQEGYNPFLGMLLEAVLTFFLVFVIWAVAVDRRAPSHIFGFAIGGTIGFDILAAGPITGAAMNPARVFGPALVSLDFTYVFWIYWVGPILGAIVAGLFYKYFFKTDLNKE